jgi:predicted small lipoprotein YifL
VGQAAGKTAKVGLSAPISLQSHDALGLALPKQSLYGAARIGDIDVISELRPTASGWAIVLLSVAALTLGACGRKGPLDLPPTASGPNAPRASAAAPAATDTEAENAAKPSVFNSTYGTDAPPVAPKGTRKPFILDPLLGN